MAGRAVDPLSTMVKAAGLQAGRGRVSQGRECREFLVKTT